jgi:hypothetical protein
MPLSILWRRIRGKYSIFLINEGFGGAFPRNEGRFGGACPSEIIC